MDGQGQILMPPDYRHGGIKKLISSIIFVFSQICYVYVWLHDYAQHSELYLKYFFFFFNF